MPDGRVLTVETRDPATLPGTPTTGPGQGSPQAHFTSLARVLRACAARADTALGVDIARPAQCCRVQSLAPPEHSRWCVPHGALAIMQLLVTASPCLQHAAASQGSCCTPVLQQLNLALDHAGSQLRNTPVQAHSSCHHAGCHCVASSPHPSQTEYEALIIVRQHVDQVHLFQIARCSTQDCEEFGADDRVARYLKTSAHASGRQYAVLGSLP